MKLTTRDHQRLVGVHPKLVGVITQLEATTTVPFMIVEGVRTFARQKELFALGKSTTMRSRHLIAPNGVGHAVDIAPLVDLDGDGDIELSWNWADFRRLAVCVKAAAQIVNCPIEWGGDWRTFKDAPHWQLPWAQFPGT